MFKVKSAIIIILLAVLLVWAARQTYKRIKYDARNNAVEVCVDLSGVQRYCQSMLYDTGNFLERLRTMGVSSIVISEETIDSLERANKIVYFSGADVTKYKMMGVLTPAASISPDTIVLSDAKFAEYINSVWTEKTGKKLHETRAWGYRFYKVNPAMKDSGWGYLPENISLAREYDFGIIYKPYKKFRVPRSLPENFSMILFTDVQTFDADRLQNVRIGVIEASPEERAFSGDLVPLKENVFRVHTIETAELSRLPVITGKFINRWLRAVRERNCRVLYINLIDELGVEENLNYVRSVCAGVKDGGYSLTRTGRQSIINGVPASAGKFLAFLFSIAGPVASLYWLRKSGGNYILKFWLFCLASILTGIVASSFISRTEFFLKLDQFRGVKLAMIVPFILSVPVLFNLDELRKMLDKTVNFKSLLIFLAVLFCLAVVIVRSNNVRSIMDVEALLREGLETAFIIRPRFKEFLFGHPLLLLGLGTGSKLLILIGFIGQLSIVNTFLHLHTPVWVSVARAVLGAITGFTIGYLILFVVKKCKHGRNILG
ncbi:MAG: DUF5693 family protein [Elusimicrobiota bacterium]